MKDVWQEVPIVRITLALILGIATENGLPLVVPPLALLAIFFCSIALLRVRRSTTARIVLDRCLLLFFFCLGCTLQQQSVSRQQTPALKIHTDSLTHIVGYVESVEKKTNSYAYLIMSEFLQGRDANPHPVRGKFYAYCREAAPAGMKPGQRIRLPNRLDRWASPHNPYQFDYARYLSRREIYHYGFFQSDEMEWLPGTPVNTPKTVSLRIRERCASVLSSHIPTRDRAAIAQALTLGKKDDIGREQKDIYRRSGTAHILAVSGLHVGIVFTLFLGIFALVRRRVRWMHTVTGFLGLSCVWGFVWIAGLPPSAVRAGVMFSFFLLARTFRLPYHSLNILGASALLILFVSPQWLFDIGFQFSYLALTGIILLYPFIRKWWRPPNVVSGYIWQIVAVSIAAQAAILPLSLYYFHGLPTYFWINSAFAIPAAYLILLLSLALLLLSWACPLLAVWCGQALDLLIGLLQGALTGTNEWLPFSYLPDLPMPVWQVLMMYGILGAVVLFLFERKGRYLLIALGLGILSNAGGAWQQIEAGRQGKLIVIDREKGPWYAFVEGPNLYLLAAERPEQEEAGYELGDIPLRHRIQNLHFLAFGDTWSDGRFLLDGQRIIFRGKSFSIPDPDAGALAGSADFLLTHGSGSTRSSGHYEHYRTGTRVLTGGNDPPRRPLSFQLPYVDANHQTRIIHL